MKFPPAPTKGKKPSFCSANAPPPAFTMAAVVHSRIVQPTVHIAELIPLHRRITLPANDTGAPASIAGDMAA